MHKVTFAISRLYYNDNFNNNLGGGRVSKF